jgi:hypothetical protein
LRTDVLWRAWVAVRTNNGAPGIDRITLEWIEKEYGIDRLLDELSSELREGHGGQRQVDMNDRDPRDAGLQCH